MFTTGCLNVNYNILIANEHYDFPGKTANKLIKIFQKNHAYIYEIVYDEINYYQTTTNTTGLYTAMVLAESYGDDGKRAYSRLHLKEIPVGSFKPCLGSKLDAIIKDTVNITGLFVPSKNTAITVTIIPKDVVDGIQYSTLTT